MGRWKAATLANSFGASATTAELVKFSTGGARIVQTGQKIWPVKGKDARKLWCVKPSHMTRDILATDFVALPNIEKFSRFTQLNREAKGLYLIALFPMPIRDKNDAEGVMTFGYVVDLNKTKPATEANVS